MLITQKNDSLRRWRFLVTAVLVLFLSACSLLPQARRERLVQLQQHVASGEAAWRVRDFPAARNAYSAAHLLAPEDAVLTLRLGLIHEHLGTYAEAADFYRAALKERDIPAALQHELTYRLALLEAFRLDGGGEIPTLISTLPPTSPYAADLQAVQALLAGDGRKALAALNQARTLPLSKEMSSIILYHAARAYHLTGDVDRAIQSLFAAINSAGYAPVSKDISEFRDFLLKQPRP